MTKSSPILLVAYGGGHVAMLAPIFRALKASGYPVTFLALTTAGKFLDNLNIPYIGYKDLPGANDADAQAYGRQLASAIPPGGPVPESETIAYLGLNYRELVKLHGAGRAESLYAEKGRQAFLPAGLFESWFMELKPSLVIATNSPRSEQAAILAAKKKGIPAICAIDLFGLQEIQWIGNPGYANKICVLNEDVRQMLLKKGRKPEEVVVTGNPAFERINSVEAHAAGIALRKSRNWNDELKTILWASQIEPVQHPFAPRRGDPELPRRIENQLRNFVSHHKGFRLVVRYHPSEQVCFREGQDRVELSPRDEDLAALLHAVDTVVVTSSTVGLEAYIAGRQVISVDCSIFTDDAPYSRMGIASGVSKVENLDELLLTAPVRNSGDKEDLHQKTSATQKILETAKQLIRNEI